MRRQWIVRALAGCLVSGGCSDEEAQPTHRITTLGSADESSTTQGTTTDPQDPTTGPASSTTASVPGATTDATDATGGSSGDDESTGSRSDSCTESTANITQQGNVLASSVFDTLFGPAYEADLAVDGDIATSWFSAGPGEDGTESTYEWYTQQDHCIDEIAIISNALHANPDFRQDFGFESGLLEIIDTAGRVAFSEPLDLPGTPDPDVRIDTGGVLGNQVRLRLMGHESEDCGGFAELVIDGRAQR